MTTLYPAQIDTPNSLLIAIDGQTLLNSAYFNSMRGAIVAIEQTLGVNPAGVAGSVGARIANLENNQITLGGDLGGSPGQALVIGLQGNPVSSIFPSPGQVLTWTGSAWTPVGGGGTGLFAAGGDLSGSPTFQIVIGIQGRPVADSIPDLNQVLAWNGIVWIPTTPTFVEFDGDLSGTSSSQTVIRLQGNAIQPGNLNFNQDGYVLTWHNASNQYQALPTGTGSSILSGDVSGPNNSTIVTKIQGNLITPGSLNKGNLLIANSSSNWSQTTVTGDILFSTITPGSATVKAIQNNTVIASSIANDGYALVSKAGSYTNTGVFPVVNVRNYGATGNGITDDTAALLAAVTVFQNYLSVGKGSAQLYFPAGVYLCSQPLIITNISGGTICGDGMYDSTIRETGTSMIGVLGQIILTNCDHTTVRDLNCFAINHFGRLSAPVSTNSNSVTLTSFNGGMPVVGQYCVLSNYEVSGTSVELLTIKSVVGTTINFVTNTIYAYATGDYLSYGVFSGVCNYSDKTIAGAKISTNNRCVRVGTGNASGVQASTGFANTCKGGGPVLLSQNANAGDGYVFVANAGQLFPGEVITISDDSHQSGLETLTIAANGVNYNTGQIIFTGTLVNNHVTTNNLSYLASQSDANNEDHYYEACVNINAMLAAWYFDGQNQLGNLVCNCQHVGIQYCGFYAIRSASMVVYGHQFGNNNGYDIVLGGPQQHQSTFTDCVQESNSGLLQVPATSGGQTIVVLLDHYDKKGGPTGKMIDCTSYGTNIVIDSSIISGDVSNTPGSTFNLTDLLAGNFLAAIQPSTLKINNSIIGITDGYYNGIYVKSFNNNYASNGVIQHLSNNAQVYSLFDIGQNGLQTSGQVLGITSIGKGTTYGGQNLRGTATFTGGLGVSFTFNFPIPEPDANYYVVLTPTSKTGSPATGSNRVLTISYLFNGFTVTCEADPGGGNSVIFTWMLLR